MSYVIKEWQGTKARSIVAMLFWKYVRSRTRFHKHKEKTHLLRIFHTAYAIYKKTKGIK